MQDDDNMNEVDARPWSRDTFKSATVISITRCCCPCASPWYWWLRVSPVCWLLGHCLCCFLALPDEAMRLKEGREKLNCIACTTVCVYVCALWVCVWCCPCICMYAHVCMYAHARIAICMCVYVYGRECVCSRGCVYDVVLVRKSVCSLVCMLFFLLIQHQVRVAQHQRRLTFAISW